MTDQAETLRELMELVDVRQNDFTLTVCPHCKGVEFSDKVWTLYANDCPCLSGGDYCNEREDYPHIWIFKRFENYGKTIIQKRIPVRIEYLEEVCEFCEWAPEGYHNAIAEGHREDNMMQNYMNRKHGQ